VQGGSTISQQTVKNLFLSQERSWWRKSREGLMSLMLEARYPKERILEVYLNEVYLGQRGSVAICGAQAAARFYFGRDLQALSLGESALLAGLVRSPGRYNPFVDPVKALGRRDSVLLAMQRLGLADAAEVERARAEPLQLASGSGGFASAPHAVDFVHTQLEERYGGTPSYEEGLRIYTTLDTRWQEQAEHALQNGLARLQREVPQVRSQRQQRLLEGAVIVTHPDTGAVLALVGGRDYRRSQFNRAVQARRQPGSCFKPFVYAAGFERAVRGEAEGLTPATLLEDSPLELNAGDRPWRPVNDDRQYRGWVSARQALEQSLNVPTVRAAQYVGLEATIRAARRSGIASTLGEVPSLALGTEVVTPLELATAYGTLARLGRHVSPWVIREVTDRDGKALDPVREPEPAEEPALLPQAAFLVNDILRGVFVHGTARSAYALGYTGGAAGKTGTTDDTRDAWFVGYTPAVLALVWVGYDDNAPTGLSGATGALPIWTDLMRRAADPRREGSFPEPEGIVRRLIDPDSGELAGAGCPEVFEEVFAEGTEPLESCSLHTSRLKRWLQKIFRKRPYVAAPGV
jgi:penicillin-binding protein 1B